MAKEKAIVFLKPGFLRYEERLIIFFARKNIEIIETFHYRFTEESLLQFYPTAIAALQRKYGNDWKKQLLDFVTYISSDAVLVFLIEGDNIYTQCNYWKIRIRKWFNLNRPADFIHVSDNMDDYFIELNALGNNKIYKA